MLHVYICKTALTGKLPEGTINFEWPEEGTHECWGEKLKVSYHLFNLEGWKAGFRKIVRAISDGSGDFEGALVKHDRMCGEGKPIGVRETIDNLTRTFRNYVLTEIKKKGVKSDKVGKLGNTVELVTAAGKKHGVSDKKLKACLAQSKKIAALLDEEIE